MQLGQKITLSVPMTIAEKISDFLTQHAGHAFCDHCLWESVKPSGLSRVQRTTRQLAAKPDFRRDQGVCADCRNERVIIFTVWQGF